MLWDIYIVQNHIGGIKMFDLQKFYQQCEAGELVDAEGVMEYIKSFPTVIIWGAASLWGMTVLPSNRERYTWDLSIRHPVKTLLFPSAV